MSNASGDDELKEALNTLQDADERLGRSLEAQRANPDQNYGPTVRKGRRDADAARKSVESLFGRIREERDRLRDALADRDVRLGEVKQAEMEARIVGSPLAFLEDAAKGYVKRPSPESRERLQTARAEAQKAFIDVCAELGRIREAALTPEEAEMLLWELDRDEEHPYFTSSGYVAVIAKLKSCAAPPDKKEQ